MQPGPNLQRECFAEILGTFFLVFFGIGAVHVAVLTGALNGLGEVAIVFGLGISLAIYSVSAVSGAHLNPAVTIAIAAFRGFPVAKIIPYILSQLIGAFLGAALLYALFSGVITRFEASKHLERGKPGSELSAMVYGEYFPNPAIIGTTEEDFKAISLSQAMLTELVGTALLVFFVFALTDARNLNRPTGSFFALFIGLGIGLIIAILASLTQAGLNPARDFGPRLFSWFAGWGSIAIPGPRGGFFTVYILSPIIGGLIGAGIYQYLIQPGLSPAPGKPDPAKV
jgi:glycerol uptake facilitator protein